MTVVCEGDAGYFFLVWQKCKSGDLWLEDDGGQRETNLKESSTGAEREPSRTDGYS
jgi:hypothetical protein